MVKLIYDRLLIVERRKTPNIPMVNSFIIRSVHQTSLYFLEALSRYAVEKKGFSIYVVGDFSPQLNTVVERGGGPKEYDKCIPEMELFFRSFHLSWQWIIDPSRDQTLLKKALRTYDLSFLSSHPVLIVPLGILPSEKKSPLILKAVAKKDLWDWSLPLKEGFGGTDADVQAYRQAHERALTKRAGFLHFVGYVKEEPVSSMTLSISASGARLDDIATKPAFQGKGFGKQMVLGGMRIAKELGCPWICLEASESGVSLYKKLGFQEIYCNEMYGRGA